MKPLLFSILISLASFTAASAQAESYDIFTFTPQPGWQRNDYNDNIQFTFQRGNSWCVVGLYKSTGSTGNANSDFQADWNDMVGKNYSLTSQVTTEQNEVNGWQMVLGTATGSIQGQQVNISLITFSSPSSRATIIMTNNDFNNQLDSDIGAFMGGVSVINANEAQPMGSSNPYQSPVGDSYQPPMVSGGGNSLFPTPAGQPVIESIMMDDGWFVEATNDYVKYSRSDVSVIQYFLTETPYPDKDGYWKQFLSRYFSTDRYDVYNQGPSYFSVEFASGNMVYNADRQQYFVAWLVNYDLASAFVAITSSEPVFKQYFPDPKNLGEMARYNNFPVSQQAIQGVWAESNSAGAQMYEVNTGNYAGMAMASASNSYTFSGNSFTFFTQGSTGMIGSANVFQAEEKGNFTLNNYTLITNTISRTDQMTNNTIAKQEQTEYSVAFKYAKNTKTLFMQNKRYSGLTYHLVKK